MIGGLLFKNISMKKYIASSILALAMTVGSVSAATISAGVNDLILGFRATGVTTGNGVNLEVDLGSVSTLKALTTGQTYDFSSRLSAADLTANFGTYNRTTLQFGVVGTTGNTANLSGVLANTVWLTKSSSPLGYTMTAAGLATTASKISTLYNSGSGSSLNGQTSTTNSAYSAVVSSGAAGSFSIQGLTSTTMDFGTGVSVISASAASGTKTLYLYEVQPSDTLGANSVTQLGSFAFNTSTGGLLYTSSFTAVPEPSTYAMIAGAFMLGFVALRRRFQK